MENHTTIESPVEKETGRVEAFSDGVFSIAMTLLVLELKVPQIPAQPTAAALWHALGKQWPSYFAFVTSFATVLIMWVNHHGIFRLVRKCDANLMFANGLLLLMVTAVPFPTALVASYLRTPAASAACAVYGGSFVVICISYTLVLLAARSGTHLLAPNAMPEVNRRLANCYFVGFPCYLAAFIAAWFSPWLSLGICSALWVFWTATGIERGNGFSQ